MFRPLSLALCLLAAPAFATDYSVGDTFDDPVQIARDAMADFTFNSEEEGRPGIDVDVSIDFFGQVTVLVAELGGGDDSVGGVRNQYVLTEQDGVWTLTFTREEYLCRRGPNTVTWQTNFCP